jgi:hypothetical protein
MTATPLARLLARPPRTAAVTVPLDTLVADRLATARTALYASIDTKGNDAPETRGIRDAVDTLAAELVTVTFHLAAIGPDAVDTLMAKHPATKEQRRDAERAGRPRPTANHDTYAPALLAAHVERIEFSDGDTLETITAAQAAKILARLSVDDQVHLHAECLRINSESTVLAGDP